MRTMRWKRPPCQLCSNMKNTSTFKSKHSNKVYQIIEFAESNTMVVPWQSFVLELTTVKARIAIFGKEQILSNQARNQKRFQEHHLHNDHNGICDWKITIIDHAEKVKSLRKKELYWYNKLMTYAPFDLNERDVYAAY